MICYSAAVGAAREGGSWQLAVALLEEAAGAPWQALGMFSLRLTAP